MVPQVFAIILGAVDVKTIAISANHLDMMRFGFCENRKYEKVSKHMQILVKKVPDLIDTYWKKQDISQKGMKSILIT